VDVALFLNVLRKPDCGWSEWTKMPASLRREVLVEVTLEGEDEDATNVSESITLLGVRREMLSSFYCIRAFELFFVVGGVGHTGVKNIHTLILYRIMSSCTIKVKGPSSVMLHSQMRI